MVERGDPTNGGQPGYLSEQRYRQVEKTLYVALGASKSKMILWDMIC